MNFRNYYGLIFILMMAGYTASAQQPANKNEQQPAYRIDRPSINDPKTNPAMLDLNQKKKDLGKFNYFFLRAGYILTNDRFNNPMTNLAARRDFTYTKALKPDFGVGLNFGFVRHVARLGTPMLRLGINTSFNFQYVSGSTEENTAGNYSLTSDGTGMFSLGIGPQVSFKANKLMRVGVYGRIGLTGIAANYSNSQRSTEYDLLVHTKMINYALSEDIGLDFTIRKFLLGVTASFAKAAPFRNTLQSSDENKLQNYLRQTDRLTGMSTTTQIDPVTSFNRITLHIGFGF